MGGTTNGTAAAAGALRLTGPATGAARFAGGVAIGALEIGGFFEVNASATTFLNLASGEGAVGAADDATSALADDDVDDVPLRCTFGLVPEDLRIGAVAGCAGADVTGPLLPFAVDAALLREPATFASAALSAFRAARDLFGGDFSCFAAVAAFFTDFFAATGFGTSVAARTLAAAFAAAGAIGAGFTPVFLALVVESVAAFRFVVFGAAAGALTVAGLRALLDGVLAILVATFCVADFCTVADFFVVNL